MTLFAPCPAVRFRVHRRIAIGGRFCFSFSRCSTGGTSNARAVRPAEIIAALRATAIAAQFERRHERVHGSLYFVQITSPYSASRENPFRDQRLLAGPGWHSNCGQPKGRRDPDGRPYGQSGAEGSQRAMRKAAESGTVRVAAIIAAATTSLLTAGCTRVAVSRPVATPHLMPYERRPSPVGQRRPTRHRSSRVMLASWYGPGFNGRRTASGEIFNQNRLTAASRTIPIGSRVQVTNLQNGRSVDVRINDCGPYVRGRSIDLSRRAARKIGIVRRGVARVRITRLGRSSDPRSRCIVTR
jgi:3D (Asp-Asp-Asp) domain-containing protein